MTACCCWLDFAKVLAAEWGCRHADKCFLMAAGEYGELLLVKADAPLQDGEEALSVSSQELVQVLETVLSRPTIKPVGREYALTALMKLSTRLPDHSHYIQVSFCILWVSLQPLNALA